MDMVMPFVVAAALAVAAPIMPDAVTRWRPFTDAAAARCALPVAWIERVMRAESAGLTMLGGRPIVSRAGAMGLMQLMPATWAMMRDRLALGIYPHDPRDNILAGTCYLRAMYDRFGYPGLFAAYNAGPGRYAEHLATGDPLPPETRFYLATVAGETAAKPQLALPPNTPLFFVMRTSSMPTGAPAAPRPSSIFVTLSSGSIPRER